MLEFYIQFEFICITLVSFLNETEIRHIYMISKYFNKLFAQYLYWKLSHSSSIKYYKSSLLLDKIFYNLVNSKMNPKKQLSINLKEELYLINSIIIDVSMLKCVHTLNLYGSLNLVDVSALATVYNLNLCYCWRISDVSMLGNVHILDISYCRNINDISALYKVHKLSTNGTKFFYKINN